ncbi:MAG: efflux transporter periplasmic adaptor subunit [Gammaproteobacteria bacterium]|nr:efflux transporter periplasmic adaptor subunit [Gammaproteobacteria bacterium]
MDQPIRSNEVGAGHAAAPSGTKAARQLGRVGAALGVVALVILVWAALSAHYASAKLKAATEQQAVVTVATTKPKAQSDLTELILPGNIQANYEAPIYARTSGYLKRWLVDIGTPVKAGQLLGEIESPEVDSQLRQAQADLATAEANQKIAGLTAERWRNLRSSDSVSKQEADEKISLAASGDAQMQAARANVQRLRQLSGFEKIVAPFDGVVTARNTDVGQLISAGINTGPELFRVADMRRLRLYVRVPQTYAAAMKAGLAAELQFPDRPGRTYAARLESTSSAIESASRTLLAQLSVDNQNGELLPGAYVEVHFKLPAGVAGESFKLPANVLLFRGDGLHVATVDASQHVVLKPVTIGRDYGSDVEIIQGLDADDNVILSPPDSLVNGAGIRVATPKPGQVTQS